MRTPGFLFPIVVAACLYGDTSFGNLIKQGQDSLARADFAGAAQLYGQACNEGGAGSLTADQQASCEHHLAVIDEARGDTGRAEERLLRALGKWEEAGEAFRPSFAMSLLNLGELYRKERRTKEAEATLTRAVAISREFQGQYPEAYGNALTRLAGVYAESAEPERARPLLVEAIAILEKTGAKEDAERAVALDTLGMIDLVAARYQDAQKRMSEAVRLSIGALGENNPETAGHQADLALAYLQDRQFDRAETLLKRARYVLESRSSGEDQRLWMIYSQSSVVATAQEKPGLAEEYAKKALALLEKQKTPDAARLALARVNLAVVYMHAHKLDDADRILPAAVDDERRVAAGTPLLADGLRELAQLRGMEHSWREAQQLYKESIELYRRRLGPNNPGLAPVLKEYAEALKHASDPKEQSNNAERRVRGGMSFTSRN